MLIHWIWLATRPELSDRQKLAVLEIFADPEDVFLASEKELSQLPELSEEARKALLDKDLDPAARILSQCMERDIQVCAFDEEAYPVRLKNIADPPLVLYYKGTLPDFGAMPTVGVVGTRKASAYGLTVARQLGFQMVRCGAIVVSGAADGIDGAAMEGALTAGGFVVGVLGNGADVVYPKCNRTLFENTRKHGCLISEFPPGTRPLKWNFPKRNRIISGLSNGVLVVEAPAISGALITARRALDQGRDVFAVPGNVGVETSEGTNALLRDGAILARDGWDVVSEYAMLYPDAVRQYDSGESRLWILRPDREETEAKVAQKPLYPEKKPVSDRKKEKIIIDKEEPQPYSDVQEILASLSEEEQLLARKITGERLVDDLIAESGLPAGKVLGILTLLEIRGVVTRLPGKRVALKQKP